MWSLRIQNDTLSELAKFPTQVSNLQTFQNWADGSTAFQYNVTHDNQSRYSIWMLRIEI